MWNICKTLQFLIILVVIVKNGANGNSLQSLKFQLNKINLYYELFLFINNIKIIPFYYLYT